MKAEMQTVSHYRVTEKFGGGMGRKPPPALNHPHICTIRDNGDRDGYKNSRVAVRFLPTAG